MAIKQSPPDASPPDFTGDEYWGQGGRYIVVDGKRIPVNEDPFRPEEVRTGAPPEADTPIQLTDQSTDQTTIPVRGSPSIKDNSNG